MEGLVLLLGELAALLLGPSIAALGLLATSVLEVVGELIGWRLTRSRRRRPDPVPPRPRRRSLQWSRRVGRAALFSLAGALLVICIVDLFFFTPLVRAITNRVATRAGIEIAFDEASGSLWSGRVVLTGASLGRSGHATGDFDFAAATIEVDLAMGRLVFLQARLESVSAVGVSGTYVRTAVAERLTSRRPFRVDRLALAQVDVRFRDETRTRPVAARIELDSLVAEPFRSNRALFDVLFRSNVEGRIAGRPITVSSKAIDGGRETSWRGDALPIAVVAPYLPGPLSWIEEGTLDVDVEDRWDIEGPADIAMDWKLDFEGIQVVVPKELPLTRRVVAFPIVKWLNRKDRRFPLRFKLNIDRTRFEGRGSPEAAGLLEAVGDSIARSLAAAADVEVDTVKDLGRRAADRVKSFLDRRRKE